MSKSFHSRHEPAEHFAADAMQFLLAGQIELDHIRNGDRLAEHQLCAALGNVTDEAVDA